MNVDFLYQDDQDFALQKELTVYDKICYKIANRLPNF